MKITDKQKKQLKEILPLLKKIRESDEWFKYWKHSATEGYLQYIEEITI